MDVNNLDINDIIDDIDESYKIGVGSRQQDSYWYEDRKNPNTNEMNEKINHYYKKNIERNRRNKMPWRTQAKILNLDELYYILCHLSLNLV